MQWWCSAQGVAWEWSWRAYPGVWLFLILGAVAYALRVRAFRVRAHGVRALRVGREPATLAPPRPRPRVRMFAGGLLVLWVALDWPIGALGSGYLASVHMLQFLLITLVAPPFLLMGAAFALEGAQVASRRVLAFATHPVVALALFTVVISVTHWPPVVDGLMRSQAGNFVLDVVWLLVGLVFWWPVVLSSPQRPWLTPPIRMTYLVAGTILNTGVFAYLTFSRLPVYATFELAPIVAGFSTRDDQLVAGLLMKMGGAAVLWTWITILFFQWYSQQERESDEPQPPPTRA